MSELQKTGAALGQSIDEAIQASEKRIVDAISKELRVAVNEKIDELRGDLNHAFSDKTFTTKKTGSAR